MNDQNCILPYDSSQNAPQISVIIPVYNVAEYLPQCLESLLTKQNCDMEVIAIDDFSTDDSWQILLAYAKNFPALRIDRLPHNCGVSSARNRGLDMARGSWIMFVDSDDYVNPECLPHLLVIAKNKQPDVVEFGARSVDESGQTINEKFRILTSKFWDFSVLEQRRLSFSVVVPFGGLLWNKLFRHDLIRDLRFDQRCNTSEDTIFSLQAFCHAQTWEQVPNVFYNYRLRPESAVYKFNKRNVLSCTIAYPAIENNFMKAAFSGQMKDVCRDLIMSHAKLTCGFIKKLPQEDRAECWQSFYENFKAPLCDPRLFSAPQRLLNHTIFVLKWQPVMFLRILSIRAIIRTKFKRMRRIKKH